MFGLFTLIYSAQIYIGCACALFVHLFVCSTFIYHRPLPFSLHPSPPLPPYIPAALLQRRIYIARTFQELPTRRNKMRKTNWGKWEKLRKMRNTRGNVLILPTRGYDPVLLLRSLYPIDSLRMDWPPTWRTQIWQK